MENIYVKINKKSREVNPKQIFIGADGENLQGNIIFSFEDEFVEGQARLDIEFRDGTKGQITELNQLGETYVLPIKSEITKYSGCIAQLVIDEGTDENSIPIFKSMYVGLIVAESINATTPIPEGYTEWIDSANAKLNQIDDKIEEVDTAVEQVNNAVERVDKGLSDLTHANEEAREIVSNFESNVESYTNDFNTNANNKTSSFNSNYDSKLSSFNSNASDKTTNFNDNADSKLSSYNSNANSKLSEYNSNAETKKTDYDTNASSKLNEYNTNATTKLEEYNTNASTKLEEYNQNASEKIEEYDNHVAEMQNTINKLEDRVDDLEDNQITLTAEGTSIHVENAAKARLYEFELEKESNQNITSGKNKFDVSKVEINKSWYGGSNGSRARYYIEYIPNENYTISLINIPTEITSIAVIEASDITSSTGNVFSQNITENTFTHQFSENANYLVLQFSANTTLTKEIANDIQIQIEEGSTATEYEEYTGGIPSPNPDFPQEVKTVKGYRNLLNISNYYVRDIRTNVEVNLTTGSVVATDNRNNANKMVWFNIPVTNNQSYKINYKNSTFTRVQYAFSSQSLSVWDDVNALTRTDISANTVITTSDVNLIMVLTMNNALLEASIDNLIITEGDQELPYVPYGNNYIAVNISDGINTNSVPLPLNGNEIAGIGNYLDEYIVDKDGHCWLNKKTFDLTLNGSENIYLAYSGTENYYYRIPFSSNRAVDYNNNLCTHYKRERITNTNTIQGFRNFETEIRIRYGAEQTIEDYKLWLSNNPVTFYLARETPELIDLNATVDLKLFKGVNNITNSEDGNMRIRYVESIDVIKEEITSIKNAIISMGGEI